jgi:hypothetical protein
MTLCDNIRAEIVTLLSGRTEACDRVFPLARTKGSKLPAIVYALSVDYERDFCGTRSIADATLTVSALGESFTDAHLLAQDIERVIDLSDKFSIDRIDDTFDPGVEVFSIDFTVSYSWNSH